MVIYTDQWTATGVVAPTMNGMNRKGGGVSILHRKDKSFKLTAMYTYALFQMVHGLTDGIPVLGA